jgi:hypothetical protein
LAGRNIHSSSSCTPIMHSPLAKQPCCARCHCCYDCIDETLLQILLLKVYPDGFSAAPPRLEAQGSAWHKPYQVSRPWGRCSASAAMGSTGNTCHTSHLAVQLS